MRAPFAGERWETRRLLALLAALSLAAAMFLIYGGTAKADEAFLNVDGTVYQPTKFSGDARHYETPDTDPTSAFSDRNTWTGNGSEHLPCPYGIHWIDNSNVLTVSHCLDGSSTTSSSADSSTTSSMDSSTTSSVDGSTTSSVDSSTTSSMDDSTTSSVDSSTTSSMDDSTTSSMDDSTTTSSIDDSTTSSMDDSTTSSVDSSSTSSVDDSSTTSSGDDPDNEVLPTVVTTTPDEVDDDELPFTGLESDVMVGLAVLFLGAGAALLAMTRRAEEN